MDLVDSMDKNGPFFHSRGGFTYLLAILNDKKASKPQGRSPWGLDILLLFLIISLCNMCCFYSPVY